MSLNIWETCFLVPGLSQSACASWVQAWGSIFAIVGAAGLFWAQGRREELRRKDEIALERWGVAMLALGALGAADNAVKQIEFRLDDPNSGEYHYFGHDLGEACELLHELLANASMFIEARIHLSAVRSVLQGLVKALGDGAELTFVRLHLTSARSKITAAVAYLAPFAQSRSPIYQAESAVPGVSTAGPH